MSPWGICVLFTGSSGGGKSTAATGLVERLAEAGHQYCIVDPEGDLGPERSFYFRGPEDQLCLQAQNLMLFSQIGEGVDDDTWQYHLEHHDYSRWFRDVIKDSSLAAKAEAIENAGLPPDESHRRIREAIDADYTLPAPARRVAP